MHEFKSLTVGETNRLLKVLRGSVAYGRGIRIGRDTSFVDYVDGKADETKVIDEIKSVPTHY